MVKTALYLRTYRISYWRIGVKSLPIFKVVDPALITSMNFSSCSVMAIAETHCWFDLPMHLLVQCDNDIPLSHTLSPNLLMRYVTPSVSDPISFFTDPDPGFSPIRIPDPGKKNTNFFKTKFWEKFVFNPKSKHFFFVFNQSSRYFIKQRTFFWYHF